MRIILDGLHEIFFIDELNILGADKPVVGISVVNFVVDGFAAKEIFFIVWLDDHTFANFVQTAI